MFGYTEKRMTYIFHKHSSSLSFSKKNWNNIDQSVQSNPKGHLQNIILFTKPLDSFWDTLMLTESNYVKGRICNYTSFALFLMYLLCLPKDICRGKTNEQKPSFVVWALNWIQFKTN